MNAIIQHSFESTPIRIEDRNGQPWFVAADICAALDIAKHRDAVGRLDDDERGLLIVDTPGGPQEVAAINESGLYALIMRSRKDAAKRFRKWVTAEVLPSIRRTGQYGAATAGIDLNDPSVLQRLLLQHTGRAMASDARIAELQPQADALAALTETNGGLCITDAAKALGVQPKRLFLWLEYNAWIYRRSGARHWVGFQPKVTAGLLDHRVTRLPVRSGPPKLVEQVLVTPKGMAKLAELGAAQK